MTRQKLSIALAASAMLISGWVLGCYALGAPDATAFMGHTQVSFLTGLSAAALSFAQLLNTHK